MKGCPEEITKAGALRLPFCCNGLGKLLQLIIQGFFAYDDDRCVTVEWLSFLVCACLSYISSPPSRSPP